MAVQRLDDVAIVEVGDEVVNDENIHRLCHLGCPEGLLLGPAESLR
ncbi:MAG TPA: hypothetical protein VG712_00680 [Gemmatimonadales bacterium]|nr:hypothetical protein [Gemmatimonadales bacterium]